MKKVYESTIDWTWTTTGETQSTPGKVKYVFNEDGDDLPLDEPVLLEQGQEALFKVTVTTIVELIDVRMSPPREKVGTAIELKSLTLTAPIEYQVEYVDAVVATEAGVISASAWVKAQQEGQEALARMQQRQQWLEGSWTTVAETGIYPPLPQSVIATSKYEWRCDRCKRVTGSSVTKQEKCCVGCTSCGGRLWHVPVGTEPKPIPPPSVVRSEYEWFCNQCGRTEGRYEHTVFMSDGDRRGSCVVCCNTGDRHRDTMTLRKYGTEPKP